MKKNSRAIVFAILAALFYALSIPFSKLIMKEIPSTLLAGLLYLGAGIGMSGLYFMNNAVHKEKKEEYEKIEKRDIKYVIAMVVLDVFAPIALLYAVENANSSTVSLLNNFEIVATSLIAFLIFKEKINIRLLLSILLITIASILLSVDFSNHFEISIGALFALVACVCWGIENNCTRNLSSKNPYLIVIIKGFGSGLTSIIIGLIIGNRVGSWIYLFYALLLGFVSYGLSVFTYVISQKYIGASRTSCYYGFAPFVGVILSFLLIKEEIQTMFYIAFVIMLIGIIILSIDTLKQK